MEVKWIKQCLLLVIRGEFHLVCFFYQYHVVSLKYKINKQTKTLSGNEIQTKRKMVEDEAVQGF